MKTAALTPPFFLIMNPIRPREKVAQIRLMPRRVARSTRDLLNTLAQIAERKAGFRSLADTSADTTSSHGRLMLIVLGALAKFERDLICTRTGEGRARARVNGMKMGRKPRLSPYLQCEAIRRRDRGQEILAVIGRSHNVSGWTLSKLKS